LTNFSLLFSAYFHDSTKKKNQAESSRNGGRKVQNFGGPLEKSRYLKEEGCASIMADPELISRSRCGSLQANSTILLMKNEKG
jgi:hypothetical protein